MKTTEKAIKTLKIAAIATLSFLNALAIIYVKDLIGTQGYYAGTESYGWNPVCVAFFALDCILLNRFIRKEVLSDKGRMITASLLGLTMGILAVMGTYMYYGTNAIFDDTRKALMIIPVGIGLSFITIPLFSELTGLADLLSLQAGNAAGQNSPPFPFITKSLEFFLIMWAVFFIGFVPLFLYSWPGNYVADAGYQVADYMMGDISTHHPPLHTFLLGAAYKMGFEHCDVNSGYAWYTILQMIVLSFSFAFFMEYLYQKKVRLRIRLIAFCLFFFNPVNSLMAISTIKGVYCSAFLIIALVFLLRVLDRFEKEARIPIFLLLGFAVFTILSCHFRNNMSYAVIVGGLIISLLQKGYKKKLILFATILVIVVGYKGSNRLIIKALDVKETDTQRESLSVPLTCLARVAVMDRDNLSEEEYAEICEFIPEDTLSEYSIYISDGIKKDANEEKLKKEKIAFLKLFVKIGLKHPADYIEQIIGMTTAYWYPLEYPYFMSGISWTIMPTYYDYPDLERTNLLPFGSSLFDYMYQPDSYGRIKVPLFGWFWRSTLYEWLYFWGVI